MSDPVIDMRLAALVLLLGLLALFGCAHAGPTAAPVGPAHWANVHEDRVHQLVSATAVNSSTAPAVLDCSDLRVTVPPRTEVDVLIPAGLTCDLQPEEVTAP